MPNPLNECFNLASRRLARVTAQIYDAALAPVGLKVTQFSVLTAVAHAHDLPLGDIANALDMDQSSLTRALVALVRDGLVELHPGKDKRQRTALLTDKGDALLAAATAAWTTAQEDIRAKLGRAMFDDGRRKMHKMRQEIAKTKI